MDDGDDTDADEEVEDDTDADDEVEDDTDAEVEDDTDEDDEVEDDTDAEVEDDTDADDEVEDDTDAEVEEPVEEAPETETEIEDVEIDVEAGTATSVDRSDCTLNLSIDEDFDGDIDEYGITKWDSNEKVIYDAVQIRYDDVDGYDPFILQGLQEYAFEGDCETLDRSPSWTSTRPHPTPSMWSTSAKRRFRSATNRVMSLPFRMRNTMHGRILMSKPSSRTMQRLPTNTMKMATSCPWSLRTTRQANGFSV